MRCASSQMMRSHSRRGFELGLQLVGARRHVEPNDQPIPLDERIAGERRLDLVARQDVELETEFLGHFVLPLLDEAARRDDQAAFQVASDQQSLISSPAMIVLPAPGSSASRKRSGWRGSISP